MEQEQFEDAKLACCDCGKPFTWLAGEKLYFSVKKLSPPKRCPSCRKIRKQTLMPDPEAWR
jgi:hypothetical protein